MDKVFYNSNVSNQTLFLMEVFLIGPKNKTKVSCIFYRWLWPERQHWCCHKKGNLFLRCINLCNVYLFPLCIITLGLITLQFSENFTIVLFHYDDRISEWNQFEWSKKAIHIGASKQTKWFVTYFLIESFML